MNCQTGTEVRATVKNVNRSTSIDLGLINVIFRLSAQGNKKLHISEAQRMSEFMKTRSDLQNEKESSTETIADKFTTDNRISALLISLHNIITE